MTLHQSITHSNPTPCSSWLHHSMPQPSGGSTPSQPVVAREHLWLPVEAVPSHPLPAQGKTFLLCTVSLLQHSPQWSLLRVVFLLFAAFHRGLNGINWLYRLCLWHLGQLKGSRDVSEREREREAGMSDWRELGMEDMWQGVGWGGGGELSEVYAPWLLRVFQKAVQSPTVAMNWGPCYPKVGTVIPGGRPRPGSLELKAQQEASDFGSPGRTSVLKA